MQGVYSLQKGDKPRDLHANLVSLHNVVLTDGAIYGTSTAVSDLKKVLPTGWMKKKFRRLTAEEELPTLRVPWRPILLM